MCIVSNLFLAIGLNFTSLINGDIGPTLKHIVSELTFQTVIISDSTMFEKNEKHGFNWWKIPKLSLSYMAYLLPTVAILSIISFSKTNLILCRPLKVEFLLNNSFVPGNKIAFDELYRQRLTYGESLESDRYKENGHLVWNDLTTSPLKDPLTGLHGPHYQQYWNFSSLDNLIDQFNFVGYHDVCNYPEFAELDMFSWNDQMKGFGNLYPGYNDRNSSGLNYKQTLVQPTDQIK